MDQKELKKFIETVRPFTPKRLYKYRSMKSEGVEDIFTKMKIFASDSTVFDDPFESMPRLTGVESSLKKEKHLKDLVNIKFPHATKKEKKKLMKGKKPLLTDQTRLKNTYKEFIKTIGVYCLSEINDNLIMWSLYADSHRGFCLEFDSSIENSLFWEAFKVIYSSEYPTVNMMEIGINAETSQKVLLTKFIGWENQKEWRILKPKGQGGPKHYCFSPSLLTEVVFGALISEDDKKTILKWVGNFPTEILTYQAKLNSKKYQVDIVPCIESVR